MVYIAKFIGTVKKSLLKPLIINIFQSVRHLNKNILQEQNTLKSADVRVKDNNHFESYKFISIIPHTLWTESHILK